MKMMSEKGYFIDQDGERSNDFTKRIPKFKDHVMLPKKIKGCYTIYV